MKHFWGFYQNEFYRVGCTGGAIYIYDKAGNEIARFKDFPYVYTAAFMPERNIIAVKSTEGILGFYDLDMLSLLKKITVTKIGGQDEGFGFSPDGSFFYNIESPTCSIRTQLGVYETRTFSKVCTLFSENKRMMLEHLEFDDNTCYLLGYMRNDEDMFDYGFVAVFDTESKAVKNIRAIDRKQHDYLSDYKHWELSGFTEKSLKWSSLKLLEHIDRTSIKEVYKSKEA